MIINDITESDPIMIAIERYKFHPRSILKINEKLCKKGDFVFLKLIVMTYTIKKILN